MSNWQLALTVVGGLTTLEVGRRTFWKGLKGFIRLGDALPHLVDFPQDVKGLREEIRQSHDEAILLRADLREHMDVEDSLALGVEKVLANMIVRQEKVDVTLNSVQHEVHNAQQIVMNIVEAGSGDRWRLDRLQPPETTEQSRVL